jgi:hypothetical protein
MCSYEHHKTEVAIGCPERSELSECCLHLHAFAARAHGLFIAGLPGIAGASSIWQLHTDCCNGQGDTSDNTQQQLMLWAVMFCQQAMLPQAPTSCCQRFH